MPRNVIAPFVGKLAQIFQVDQIVVQNQRYSHIISWSKNQIVIKDPQEFVSSVLPKYFRHVKLQSFVRQLNLYGFNKVPTTDKSLIFKHEHFERENGLQLPLVQLKSKFKDIRQREEQCITDPLFSNRVKLMLESSAICFQICLVQIREKLEGMLRVKPEMKSECTMALFMIESSIHKQQLVIGDYAKSLGTLVPS